MLPQLIHAFDYTVQFIELSVADLSDEQMVEQPPAVPNHAMWTLGHVTFSCQGIAQELGVEPWLPSDWEATFGYGSSPSPDLSAYPTKKEMSAILADAANRLRQALLAVDADDLNPGRLHHKSFAKQYFFEIGVVPAGGEAFVLDAEFLCGFVFQ